MRANIESRVWLVSFGDLLTLLLAFFLTIVSHAGIHNQNKTPSEQGVSPNQPVLEVVLPSPGKPVASKEVSEILRLEMAFKRAELGSPSKEVSERVAQGLAAAKVKWTSAEIIECERAATDESEVLAALEGLLRIHAPELPIEWVLRSASCRAVRAQGEKADGLLRIFGVSHG